MIEIDAINSRILLVLESDGRITNAELAQKVGLSPSACLRRVQELERCGLIKGYRAVLDRSRMGAAITVFVMVGLSGHLKSMPGLSSRPWRARLRSVNVTMLQAR